MFHVIFNKATRDTAHALMSTALGLGFFHGGKMVMKKINPDISKIKIETDARSVTKRS